MKEREPRPSPLHAILDVKRGEWGLALSMFGYFFLVITTFWILKPLKKAVFVEEYELSGFDLLGWQLNAAQAEQIAKVANMAVAAVAVVVFTALSRRLHRERLSLTFITLFVVTLGGYALVLHMVGDLVAWSFYLYGDLYTTLMVATFFAFLNDSVTPETAKRIYGLIVLGGVSGGAFGSTVLAIWITEIERGSWMWICILIQVLIALCALNAGRLVRSRTLEPTGPREPSPESQGNPALEGARLVFRSRYLLAIAAIVGLYEIVSTILDFQFTSTILAYLDGPAIGQQFATVYLITNIASLVVQLFLTTMLMNRFPLTVSLLITPLVIGVASMGFLVVPILWVGSLLNTADNAFSYSINQSAREALYTPTSRDEKYKAKAFIDMFVQRSAKALAVGIALLISSLIPEGDVGGARWLSIVVLAVIALWIVAARYAGKAFQARTREAT